MQTATKESGLPFWPLYAAIPVVLALGFVSGMAIANYRVRALPATAPNPPVTEDAAAAPTPSKLDNSWVIPVTGTTTLPEADPSLGTAAPPVTGSSPGVPVTPGQSGDPAPVYFSGPANNIDEARLALLTDYRTYRGFNASFAVDYEKMRPTAGGASLVGLISVNDYSAWVKVLQEEPDKLKQWLEKAATRVLPASSREGFHLVWAVVDVTRERPADFTDGEVTPLDNRSYLVIRPLAATIDHSLPDVSLRSAASLVRVSPSELQSSPWSTYGPALRFDDTDLYRPSRAREARPLY